MHYHTTAPAIAQEFPQLDVLFVGAGTTGTLLGCAVIDVYLRSVVAGGTVFIAVCTLPISAKWALIGRCRRQRIRIWSLEYVRFCKTLVSANPLVLFSGSPLYVPYLRALGAKIGRGVVVFSRHPYAAGNAMVFQPMAGALRDSGLNIYAVELLGHDLTVEPEPFASMERVVDQVVSEITARALDRVLLWGHAAGAEFAAATAWALQERDVRVERLFVGAELLGSAADRCAAIRELTRQTAAEIATALTADDGYTALGELDARRATHVGAAFRHDWLSRAPLPRRRPRRPTGGAAVLAGHRGRRRRRSPYGRLTEPAPELAAPRRARRSPCAPRGRPLLPATPSGGGGASRSAGGRAAHLALTVQGDRI